MEYELYRKTKWLKFIITDRKPKTLVLHVLNTSNDCLGIIRWYGPWRQYVLNVSPVGELTFNCGCLQDIADVLIRLNKAHKTKKSNL